MVLNVLAILGSPRKGGNSDTLVAEAIKGIKQKVPDAKVRIVRVSDLNIKPCNACGRCHTTGKCDITDRMQDIYRLFSSSDIILVGSPIYFMGPPAQLKAMVDRSLGLWSKKMLMKIKNKRPNKRTGAIFLTAGDKNKKMFLGTLSILRSFLWTLDVKVLSEVLAGGMDAKGSVKKCPAILAKARRLGNTLALGPK